MEIFFEKVKVDVAAIDEFSKRHPRSVDISGTNLKRYMSETRWVKSPVFQEKT